VARASLASLISLAVAMNRLCLVLLFACICGLCPSESLQEHQMPFRQKDGAKRVRQHNLALRHFTDSEGNVDTNQLLLLTLQSSFGAHPSHPGRVIYHTEQEPQLAQAIERALTATDFSPMVRKRLRLILSGLDESDEVQKLPQMHTLVVPKALQASLPGHESWVIDKKQMPSWATEDGACPDQWQTIGFNLQSQRLFCAPETAQSTNMKPLNTPHNSRCQGGMFSFAEGSNRCFWTLVCKVQWSKYGCYLTKGSNSSRYHSSASRSIQDSLVGGSVPLVGSEPAAVPNPSAAHASLTQEQPKSSASSIGVRQQESPAASTGVPEPYCIKCSFTPGGTVADLPAELREFAVVAKTRRVGEVVPTLLPRNSLSPETSERGGALSSKPLQPRMLVTAELDSEGEEHHQSEAPRTSHVKTQSDHADGVTHDEDADEEEADEEAASEERRCRQMQQSDARSVDCAAHSPSMSSTFVTVHPWVNPLTVTPIALSVSDAHANSKF